MSQEKQLVLNYDLIVCGAGPSGAMAAATAAQAGLKVALLEKHSLPRHKTCGGGTPVVMQTLLHELAPEAFVEADVTTLRQTWKFSDPYLAAINPPQVDRSLSIWMMQRSIFDNALAQRAAKAGAELRDGLAVRAIDTDTDGIRVHAQTIKPNGDLSKGDAWVATARVVIGADGANGITAKAANLRQKPTIALGMEVELPHTWSTGHPDLRPDVAHLEYGAIERGYAWIFPKANHLNVGAGLFRPDGRDARNVPHIREALQQVIFNYLDALQVPYDRPQLKFHGHPLPLWGGKEPLNTKDGRILLVGDAAGLINPAFGDGILHAAKSGIIAANCVIDGTPTAYSDRIHTEFSNSFDAARRLAYFFYQYPKLFYQYGVKNPRAAHIATQLLAGEMTFDAILGRAFRRVGTGLLSSFLPGKMRLR
ncbi:MAG: geranylgeranyl reductase family protein [Lyngbya sp. HA4199-MV5]|nr:geranylgeranyl reductase family protein [Lyngbya sp. HA4199-MV5]